MKVQHILRSASIMVHIPAGMALLSLPISLAYNEPEGVTGFLIAAAAALIVGQSGYWTFRNLSEDQYNLSDLMWIASLGWILVVLTSTIPFLYVTNAYSPAQIEQHVLQPFQDFSNIFFESTSGFTSAGLSMVVKDASELPKSLQWWRSFMQWVGGIGIIAFITAYASQTLDTVQGKFPKHYDSQTVPSVNLNVQKVWWIYIFFTFLCFLALFLQGVPLWEAINHSMTSVATGGFTITDNSLYTYHDKLLVTLIPFFIIGALNFSLWHQLFTQFALKKFISNRQHIAFIIILILGTWLLHTFQPRNISSWLTEAFQFISALSTCGFQSESLRDWNDGSLLLLTLAMLVGGVTSSTAGGLKIFRLLIFLKATLQNVAIMVLQPDQLGEQAKGELKTFRIVAIFCFCWVFVWLIGVFVMWYHLHPKYPLSAILFENASAISTVGLSTGITSPDLPLAVKLTLILEMWIGRLELIPLFLLIAEGIRLVKHK
jgi:trk system potassium uptake protein